MMARALLGQQLEMESNAPSYWTAECGSRDRALPVPGSPAGDCVIAPALVRFLFWEAAVLAASVRLPVGSVGRTKMRGSAPCDRCDAGSLHRAGALFRQVEFGGRLLGGRRPGSRYSDSGDGGASRRSHGEDWRYAAVFGLTVPLVLLAFRPVEEIDSINYLHYLIDWMGNRATPYVFRDQLCRFLGALFSAGLDGQRGGRVLPSAGVEGGGSDGDGGVAGWPGTGRAAERLAVGGVRRAGDAALLVRVFRSADVEERCAAWRGFRAAGAGGDAGRAGPLSRGDMALLAFGLAFAAVKYTGIFVAAIAVGLFVAFGTRPPVWIWALFSC